MDAAALRRGMARWGGGWTAGWGRLLAAPQSTTPSGSSSR